MHYIWYILLPTLSFNSKRLQIFLVIFDFILLEWRVVKNYARDLWLHSYFLKYWPLFQFFLLWNPVLKMENPSERKNRIFFWGISGTVFFNDYYLKCILLLKKLGQWFFEVELKWKLATFSIVHMMSNGLILKQRLQQRLVTFHASGAFLGHVSF